MMYDTYIMKRTQIYLEADQDRRLASRATASGVTKSTLIREAIEVYLAKPDDADELAAFRAAIDAAAGAPVELPDGATYVETLRAADVARQAELDERRG
jgi:predicted DNA-binding protein